MKAERALGVAAVAVLAACLTTASCGGDGAPSGAAGSEVLVAVRAAAETARETTSARFEATLSAPQAAGGDVTMSGTMAWAPETVMDVTVSGGGLGLAGTPREAHALWSGGVMYLDMGAEFGAAFDGRSWMRLDPAALAGETGDQALADALSFGLDDADRDPAGQMALLLQSPEIAFRGTETRDGARLDHYEGTVSVEDALAGGDGAGLLTEAERQEVAAAMREQGIDGYHLDVWLDGNDFPVEIHQAYATDQGPVEYRVRYDDLGADVSVTPPAASATVDFLELLSRFEAGFGAALAGEAGLGTA